jgi:hypothetical protein
LERHEWGRVKRTRRMERGMTGIWERRQDIW